MYVCMSVYVFMNVCKGVVYTHIHVCACACMYIGTYVCICSHACVFSSEWADLHRILMGYLFDIKTRK